MPVFCFHASEGRGSSAASDSPLSVPMLAGLAVSDVLVEAAEQLVPQTENCASLVLLLVVSVSAGFLGAGRALFNHLSIFPETSSGYTRLQGKLFDIVMLFRCWYTRGCMGLFLAVRVSYSIPWTVWKCKSDFYQRFLAYPRCHCAYPSLGIAGLENLVSHSAFFSNSKRAFTCLSLRRGFRQLALP